MSEPIHTAERLAELQALPLERKIMITQTRIIEWYQHYDGNVVVSFSGGKDSSVLLHIARQMYPDIRAVFSDTGLEYPEIRKHVKSFDGVDIVRPSMRFDEVISKYGYPLIGKEVAEAIYYARRIRKEQERIPKQRRSELIGNRKNEWVDWRRRCLAGDGANLGNQEYVQQNKTGKSIFNKEKYLPLARDIPIMISHYCCHVMKKKPMHSYQRNNRLYPIIGTITDESRSRKQAWITFGCNAFDGKNPHSNPLSFWTEQDILRYIVQYDVKIPSVYGDIVAVDRYGIEYSPEQMLLPDCKLKCTGCDRTGQINAAR